MLSVRLSDSVASAFVPFTLLTQWVVCLCLALGIDMTSKNPLQTHDEVQSGTCCAASSTAAAVQLRSRIKAYFVQETFFCLFTKPGLLSCFICSILNPDLSKLTPRSKPSTPCSSPFIPLRRFPCYCDV